MVITVPAKKMDWPKLQLGLDLVTFLTAEIPLLVACTILVINSSNSASEIIIKSVGYSSYKSSIMIFKGLY